MPSAVMRIFNMEDLESIKIDDGPFLYERLKSSIHSVALFKEQYGDFSNVTEDVEKLIDTVRKSNSPFAAYVPERIASYLIASTMIVHPLWVSWEVAPPEPVPANHYYILKLDRDCWTWTLSYWKEKEPIEKMLWKEWRVDCSNVETHDHGIEHFNLDVIGLINKYVYKKEIKLKDKHP